MSSKCSTGKNTSVKNQPPSHEVTNSVSNKPLEFPTFDLLSPNSDFGFKYDSIVCNGKIT